MSLANDYSAFLTVTVNSLVSVTVPFLIIAVNFTVSSASELPGLVTVPLVATTASLSDVHETSQPS
nr:MULTISPECIES: hypothetical protein [Clostridium]